MNVCFCVSSSSKSHCTPTLSIHQTGLAHTGKKHTGLAYSGRAPVRSLFVIIETRNRPLNPYQRQSFRNVQHHLQVSLSKHVAVVAQSVAVQTRNISSLRPIFSLSTLANWKIGQKASARMLLSLGRITRRRVTPRLPRQDEGPVMTGNRRTPPRICLGVVGWAEIKSRTNRFVRPSPLFLAGSFPWETITVERPWSWVFRVAGTRSEVQACGGTQLRFDYFNRGRGCVFICKFVKGIL